MNNRHRILLLTIPLAASSLSTSAASAAMGLKPKSKPAPVTAANQRAKPEFGDVARLTAAASTLSYSMSTTVIKVVNGTPIEQTITATAEFDGGQKSSQMTMNLGPSLTPVAKSAAQGLPDEDNPANYKIRVITIGSDVWMSYPLLSKASGVPNTKPWVHVNATELGVTAQQLAASQGTDPSQGLQYLKGLGVAAKVVGTEQMDGVSTTHYAAAISRDGVTKTASPTQMSQIMQVFGNQNVLPVDIWVDAQGRARRLDLSMTSNMTNMQTSVKSSHKFGKFGEPVNIAAPPVDQVMQLSDSPVLQKSLTQK